jgi:hypothetical protein
MTCREWLAANGYGDVVALMDEAIRRIEEKGKKSRRNWWDTLAGGSHGKPSVREGIEFPVLRAAQIRQGVPVSPNAIWRKENEEPPDVVVTDRWKRKALPTKVRKLANKKTGSSGQAKAS